MNDVQAFREALDNSLHEDMVTRDHRIQAVKSEVTSRLKRGVPVSITQEMIDLGIDKNIAKQLTKAENEARIKKLFTDEDDEEEIQIEPNRPIFF